jgi:cytoskeletal protein CcmA (bactofilin family)
LVESISPLGVSLTIRNIHPIIADEQLIAQPVCQKMEHATRYVPSLLVRKSGQAKFDRDQPPVYRGEEVMLFKNGTEKRGSPPLSSAPSILSDDLTIEGNVISEGEVHINGTVKGDVTARKLTLGEDGAITGAVEVDDAVIAGKLAGRVTATSVVLLNTARVSADITHISLSIAPEAIFEGFSRCVDTIDDAKDSAVHAPRLAAPTVQSI